MTDYTNKQTANLVDTINVWREKYNKTSQAVGSINQLEYTIRDSDLVDAINSLGNTFRTEDLEIYHDIATDIGNPDIVLSTDANRTFYMNVNHGDYAMFRDSNNTPKIYFNVTNSAISADTLLVRSNTDAINAGGPTGVQFGSTTPTGVDGKALIYHDGGNNLYFNMYGNDNIRFYDTILDANTVTIKPQYGSIISDILYVQSDTNTNSGSGLSGVQFGETIAGGADGKALLRHDGGTDFRLNLFAGDKFVISNDKSVDSDLISFFSVNGTWTLGSESYNYGSGSVEVKGSIVAFEEIIGIAGLRTAGSVDAQSVIADHADIQDYIVLGDNQGYIRPHITPANKELFVDTNEINFRDINGNTPLVSIDTINGVTTTKGLNVGVNDPIAGINFSDQVTVQHNGANTLFFDLYNQENIQYRDITGGVPTIMSTFYGGHSTVDFNKGSFEVDGTLAAQTDIRTKEINLYSTADLTNSAVSKAEIKLINSELFITTPNEIKFRDSDLNTKFRFDLENDLFRIYDSNLNSETYMNSTTIGARDALVKSRLRLGDGDDLQISVAWDQTGSPIQSGSAYWDFGRDSDQNMSFRHIDDRVVYWDSDQNATDSSLERKIIINPKNGQVLAKELLAFSQLPDLGSAPILSNEKGGIAFGPRSTDSDGLGNIYNTLSGIDQRSRLWHNANNTMFLELTTNDNFIITDGSPINLQTGAIDTSTYRFVFNTGTGDLQMDGDLTVSGSIGGTDATLINELNFNGGSGIQAKIQADQTNPALKKIYIQGDTVVFTPTDTPSNQSVVINTSTGTLLTDGRFTNADGGGDVQTKELHLYGPSTTSQEAFGDFRFNVADGDGVFVLRHYNGARMSYRDSADNQIFALYTNGDGGVNGPGTVLVNNTIRPETSAVTANLGAPSQPFNNIYANNSTIQSSDKNKKSDIQELSEVELRIALKAKKLVRKFKLNEAIEKKGEDNARYHIGIIAQDLHALFEEEGLDAFAYGILCYDDVLDSDGNPSGLGGSYSVRYTELLAFIIAAL